jgi:hypothetical protein
MGDRIIELLYRNLQEVFGESDAGRRRHTQTCTKWMQGQRSAMRGCKIPGG